MKKFITTLAAALVIGSAASAATFVEVFRIDQERYMIKVPATDVLRQVVDTHAIPTAGGTYDVESSIIVADYNWEALPDSEYLIVDADPFAEEIVGGLGPQLPYDPMRGVDYGFVQALKHLNAGPFAEEIVADYNWDAIPTSERITSVTVANYNWEALPAAERVPTSAMVVYNFDVLPAAERTDVETFSVAGN